MNQVTSVERVKGSWWALGTLSLVSMLDWADRSLVSVASGPIQQEFELSDTQLGMLFGIAFVLVRLFINIPIGRLSDVWNRRNVVMLSLSLLSIATIAFGLA